MLRLSLVFSLLLLTDACKFDTSVSQGAAGDDSGPDARPGEVADAANDDGALPISIDANGDAGTRCFEPTLEGEASYKKMGNAGCTSWSSLQDLEGEVLITRNGAMLSVEFEGGQLFVGTIDGNTVTLVYSREEPTNDGCQWQADETLTGSLDESVCELSLDYAYLESVIVSDGFCDFACSYNGNGSVDIQPLDEG
jgi:hypothetical protein